MTTNQRVPSFKAEDIKSERLKKNEFLSEIASYRPDLFRFCRKLTNNPWDAEDLVQEAIVVAYGRLADKHSGIENLKSYLFKMASNQWLTWCRRNRLGERIGQLQSESDASSEMHLAQDSLSTLIQYLPPKERVALVLSEAFDSKNEEIAEIMGSTEGAVKSALFRAREKLKGLKADTQKPYLKNQNPEVEEILSLAVRAFNHRDIDGFAKLFAKNAIGNAPGCFYETSAEEIKNGSLFYTINTYEGKPQPENVRAEKIEFNGEPLFALFDGDQLEDLWKLTIEDGKILRFDCYYCCPDVLSEVAQTLNKKANHHGYWFEQTVDVATSF